MQSRPSVFQTINQRLYKTNRNQEEKLNLSEPVPCVLLI